MSLQTIPLTPPSKYSSDPVGDAIKALAQVAPGATPSWVYWSDPATSSSSGTGLWQFKGSAYYQPFAGADPVIYTISCGGCAVTSVGGDPAAPAPSFTSPVAMVQSHGPLFGTGLVPVVGRVSGLNSQIIETIEATNPSTIVADITDLLSPLNKSNMWWIYYNDPPTAAGWGTGIWRLKATSLWYASATGQPSFVTIVQTGGCARNCVGGAPAVPPPSSFGTIVPLTVNSLFPFL
jgi:hypothetical protein